MGTRALRLATPAVRRRALLRTAVVVAAVAYIAAVSVHYTEAMAADVMDVNEPSIMNLKLKPRTQEVILETKAEHINEDFSHEDLVGAIYTEGDLRGNGGFSDPTSARPHLQPS